eukprot:scaffold11.g3921.t1
MCAAVQRPHSAAPHVVELSPAKQAAQFKGAQAGRVAEPVLQDAGDFTIPAVGGPSPTKQLQSVRAIGARLRAEEPAAAPVAAQRQGAADADAAALSPGFSEPSILWDISAALRNTVELGLQAPTPPHLPAQAQLAEALEAAAHKPSLASAPGPAPPPPAAGRRGGPFAQALPPPGSPQAASTSPLGGLPVPPPPPPVPVPIGTESTMDLAGALSPLSPFFMSSKSKALYCEIDDPGRNIAFPPAPPRRTGRMRRALASVFSCFVPPAAARSPAPSFKVPSRDASRDAIATGSSPVRLAFASSVNPLRSSLVDTQLATEGSSLCEQLRASLSLGSPPCAAAPGATAQEVEQRASPAYADLVCLGDAQGDSQVNLASPELSRRGAVTPPEGSPYAAPHQPGHSGDSHAKRNLLDAMPGQQHPARQGWRAAAESAQPQGPLHEEPSGPGALGARHSHRPASELDLPAGLPIAQPSCDGQQPASEPALLASQHSGSKRTRDALGASQQLLPGAGPKLAKRGLSKPAYRSPAFHAVLSPVRQRPSSAEEKVRRPTSAAAKAPAQAARRPASPPPAGAARPPGSLPPRMTRAAEVRAAATQRQLQQRQQRATAFLAHSPVKALREAAAAGLSLRDVAGAMCTLVSPGKSARLHYARAETPCEALVPALSAGEQGAEPFSARPSCLGKAGGSRARELGLRGAAGGRLASAASRVRQARAQAGAAGGDRERRRAAGTADAQQHTRRAAETSGSGGVSTAAAAGTLDMEQYEAQRQGFLSMLHQLASGLQVDAAAVQQAKALTPPPASVALLAAAGAQQAPPPPPHGAAPAQQQERQRWQEAEARGDEGSFGEAVSLRTSGASTVAYSPRLFGESSHMNCLYAASPTASPSEQVAQQRMVPLGSAAAETQAQQQWRQQERRRQLEPQWAAAAAPAANRDAVSAAVAGSISFGTVGSADQQAHDQQAHEQQSPGATDASVVQLGRCDAGGQPTVSKPARRGSQSRGLSVSKGEAERLLSLADLLAERPQGLTLEHLRDRGFTRGDMQALQALLRFLTHQVHVEQAQAQARAQQEQQGVELASTSGSEWFELDGSFEGVIDPASGAMTIAGFGSLLSLTLSVEPHEGAETVVTLFEVEATPQAIAAFVDREHEFRFCAVRAAPLDGAGAGGATSGGTSGDVSGGASGSAAASSGASGSASGDGAGTAASGAFPWAVVCTRNDDERYRATRCPPELWEEMYGVHGIDRLWRDDIKPCRAYLRHCVLAARALGPAAHANFLDQTWLGDRRTTVRAWLEAHPAIMEELPPPSLIGRANKRREQPRDLQAPMAYLDDKPALFVVDAVLRCTGGPSACSLLSGRLVVAGTGDFPAAHASPATSGGGSTPTALLGRQLVLYVGREEPSPKALKRAPHTAPFRICLRCADHDDMLLSFRGLEPEVLVDEELSLVEWGSSLRIAMPSPAAARQFAQSLWRVAVARRSLAGGEGAALLDAARCCTPLPSPRVARRRPCPPGVTPGARGGALAGHKRRAGEVAGTATPELQVLV